MYPLRENSSGLKYVSYAVTFLMKNVNIKTPDVNILNMVHFAYEFLHKYLVGHDNCAGLNLHVRSWRTIFFYALPKNFQTSGEKPVTKGLFFVPKFRRGMK
jgi:hypothetical protein